MAFLIIVAIDIQYIIDLAYCGDGRPKDPCGDLFLLSEVPFVWPCRDHEYYGKLIDEHHRNVIAARKVPGGIYEESDDLRESAQEVAAIARATDEELGWDGGRMRPHAFATLARTQYNHHTPVDVIPQPHSARHHMAVLKASHHVLDKDMPRDAECLGIIRMSPLKREEHPGWQERVEDAVHTAHWVKHHEYHDHENSQQRTTQAVKFLIELAHADAQLAEQTGMSKIEVRDILYEASIDAQAQRHIKARNATVPPSTHALRRKIAMNKYQGLAHRQEGEFTISEEERRTRTARDPRRPAPESTSYEPAHRAPPPSDYD